MPFAVAAIVGWATLMMGAFTSILHLVFSPEFQHDPINFIIALMAIGLFFMATYFMVELNHMRKVWLSPLVEKKIQELKKRLNQPNLMQYEKVALEEKIKELQTTL